ncbi:MULTISPECIES: helix-turn-helix domain-containing protein [Cohnella]|uniref:Helix-turn-helix protein n=1 Tax=Cohnella phaseoli TaxID=456490 RepID=A0A3D9KI06_9BACL|nr:helix-turn-helix domain-containing protein [Cohnella phaseoli]RED85516.1 helix-turn-helix protein [Cohnella phaseoli]
MYRVLLAEDEILVRLGLKNSIDWQKYGMQVVADVPNGEEAWSAYEKLRPEVVITDLKMPIMGGIELLTRIRSVSPQTRLLILTCLEEFELAKQAMSLGVSGYVVKQSMTAEEMEEILVRLRGELDAAFPEPSPKTFATRTDMEVLKENLIKDYLFLSKYSDEEFARRAKELELNLSPRNLTVCAMEIGSFERLREKFKDDNGQLIRLSLMNVLNEVIHIYGRCEAFHDLENRYAILYSHPEATGEKEAEETLFRMTAHLRRVMNTYFNVPVTFGISGKQNAFQGLKRQYYESLEALERSFAEGVGRDYAWGRGGVSVLPAGTRDRLHRLADAWATANEKYSADFAGNIADFVNRGQYRSRPEALKAFMQWLHAPVLALRLAGEEMTALCSAYAQRLSGAGTLEEMVSLLEDYAADTLDLLAARQRKSGPITRALRYIESRYTEDLSLQQVADSVSMNANYFSTLFKKEMKQNFVDYLLQYRVERARELFLNTSLKAYEIGERVGFVNTSHFSRAFKKVCGMSPREYRKQWDGGAEEDDRPEHDL